MKVSNRIPMLLLVGGFATGCASAVQPVSITPEALAAAEADRLAHPDDPNAIVRAGIAYYQAGAFARARDVLQMALVLDPDHFSGAVYLGLAAEKDGDLTAAREAYLLAAGMKLNRSQRAELDARLTLLGRLELVGEAKRAIAREAELSELPVRENAIVVLPFRYVGADPELHALGAGMTQLVVSDLSKIQRLVLLERERVQALIDELQIADAGFIDSATAVRTGRLLRASHVVQGVIREAGPGGVVHVDARVVRTEDGSIRAAENASDRLSNLLSLESGIVLGLLDQLNVVPTPAESRALSTRPTSDLQAFMAFSRGAEAESRGDLATARSYFNAATSLDSEFGIARSKVSAVSQLSAALRSSPERLMAVATMAPIGSGSLLASRSAALGTAVANVAPSVGDQLARRAADPPRNRGRVQEGLNRDDPSLLGILGTLIIVIPRP